MTTTPGIALLCTEQGEVIRVLNDSMHLGSEIQPGTQLTRLVVAGGLDKMLSFLLEVNSRQAAFDWDINLNLKGEYKTLYFAGGKFGDSLVVVGAENGQFSLQLFEEMMRINNEQTNLLRGAMKDQVQTSGRDLALFDEVSRLNNELVAAQRELAKQNAELERLNKEKNRFLGMAAHDLRNPLHGILASSEFILDTLSAGIDPEAVEFIQMIRDSSHFMVTLVDDLLDVAKIESGQLNLDYAPVDLEKLVARNVARNQTIASKKSISIDLIKESLPTVSLDAAKFEQVLNNLITNAVKYSPAGARITVRLENQTPDFLLAVKDQGVGMSAEEQTRLFQPFHKGRAGTQGEASTGLGLVIVKRIIEGHQGKIWLESQPGKGTTFFIKMPMQPADRSPQP